MYAGTQTRSTSSTMTTSRVEAVMSKVHDDVWAFVSRGAISHKQAAKWYDDLMFMLLQKAITWFEFQIYGGGRRVGGVRYEIFDDGSLIQDQGSGGLDLWGLPEGATATIVVSIKAGLAMWVQDNIVGRGFTVPTTALEGQGVRDRAYSKSGYGVVRLIFGAW